MTKKPRISFSKDSILSFLARHGEKLVVAGFGLFACMLAYGGVEALQSMRPGTLETPEAIEQESVRTSEHIDSVKEVPEQYLTKEQNLPAKVAPWIAVTIAPPPQPLILDKPLFAELAKRTSPDILPI